MGFWNGVGEEALVVESANQLRTNFSGWTAQARVWYHMAYSRPSGRGAAAFDASPRGPHQKTLDFLSEFVSNRVEMIHLNYIGRVSKARPQIDVMALVPEADQQAKQGLLERWCQGVVNEQDLRVQSTARGTSWRRRVIENSSCPGSIIGRVQVRETFPGSGQATVDWPLFDPLTCYYDFDSWPRRFVREFQTGAQNAKMILGNLNLTVPAGLDLDTKKPVTFTEFWVEEDNGKGRYKVSWACLVDNHLASGVQQSKMRRWPLIIVNTHAAASSFQVFSPTSRGGFVAGSTPESDRGITQDDILYHARPFWASLENTHRQYQQYASLLMEGLAWALNGPKMFISEDGTWIMKPEELGPGSRVALKPEERIEIMQVAMANVEAAAKIVLGLVEGDYNRNYNPHLFGEGLPGESGFASDLRSSHAEAHILEAADGASTFVKLGLMEALQQFMDAPNLEMTLRGRTNTGIRGGHIFLEDFSPKDMPESYVLDVQMPPDIPRNKMAALQLALEGIRGGVWSLAEGRREVGITDSIATQRLIDADAVSNSPVMAQKRILENLVGMALEFEDRARRAKDPDRQQALQVAAEWVRSYQMSVERQMGLGQMPATATPAQPSPDVLPPEMGKKNPDQAALAMGEQSSSTGGRPPVEQPAGQ